MSDHKNLSLYEFFEKFPHEESARLYFETGRWSAGVFCPHCGSYSVSECKDHRPMPYRCKDCRKHFSVRTGTVLEESRLPLLKWLMAIYMMSTARKGIPSTQMEKELGITQKSAWFLAQRIWEAWLTNGGGTVPSGGQLGGEFEVNETFIGGKESSNTQAKDSSRAAALSAKQAIVIGMKQRNRPVVAQHIPDTSKSTLHYFT